MADQSSPIPFDDIPLDEARRMGRGPRMDPEVYRALQQKLPSLDTTAVRMTIPEGISPATMKHRILRVAAALGLSVTIRNVAGGLLFWRSTAEDVQQAHEIAGQMQTRRPPGNAAQRTGHARPAARQRRPVR